MTYAPSTCVGVVTIRSSNVALLWLGADENAPSHQPDLTRLSVSVLSLALPM